MNYDIDLVYIVIHFVALKKLFISSNYFTSSDPQEGNDCQISCYVPINPLDISSDWTCTKCKHTISAVRIRELEEIAQKIVISGR